MEKIKIIEQYIAEKFSDGDIEFELEKKWKVRPAWIRVIKSNKPMGRFARISLPKTGEVLYRTFGRYFIPYDYTNAEEQRFMDAMAAEYDEMVADRFNKPMAKALVSCLPLGKINKDANILDLGCGTGILTDILIKEGFLRFTLTDFSKGVLAQAKQKLKDNKSINYEVADITKKIPKGKFDVVVSVMLFNTFDEKTTDGILKRLMKQMTPKSLFCVLEDSPKNAYVKYFKPVVSRVVDTGLRDKYIFVGVKK